MLIRKIYIEFGDGDVELKFNEAEFLNLTIGDESLTLNEKETKDLMELINEQLTIVEIT